MLLYIYVVYAAVAAYLDCLLLGSDICCKFGVRFTDTRRASSTFLGVKISKHFLMWWAAQLCLVQ